MVILKEEKNNSVIKGALSLTLSVLIVKIIGFIYKIPLSYILTDEGMGYFNSAYTVFTFFYVLCSGGVPRGVSILVAKASVEGSADDVEKILSVTLRVFISIGISFTLLLLLFSNFFAKLIGNSDAYFSLFCRFLSKYL